MKAHTSAGGSRTQLKGSPVMAKGRDEFTDVLMKKGILGPDQLNEAKALQQQTGAKLQDALIKLGYATQADVMNAVAEASGMQSVSLENITIPASIIEMVPESVARENVVVPLSQENGALRIAVHDPSDFEIITKLQFILNKD